MYVSKNIKKKKMIYTTYNSKLLPYAECVREIPVALSSSINVKSDFLYENASSLVEEKKTKKL